MVAIQGGRQSLRLWASAIAAVLAAVIATTGIALRPNPESWLPLVVASAIAILAASAVLRFRQANRTIFLGWGEAALVIVVFLAPGGWVPAIIGTGSFIGQSVFRLWTGVPFAWRVATNTVNITLSAAAGVVVAHGVAQTGINSFTARSAIALVAGALGYFLVSCVLVNLSFGGTAAEYVLAVGRTAVGKLPMVAGNVTIGIVSVGLFATDKLWLLMMPPVIVLTHQTYVYRSRASDERRTWREFADIARSLNQLDERGVAVAAAQGLLKLFVAATVEVWVERLAGPARGYRGTPYHGGYDVVELAGLPGEQTVPVSAARALAIGGVRVGEVRLWMPAGSTLEARDHMVMSAVCEAIAAALHDASAHRALRTLAARSFHDAHHDVLTGVPNRATIVRDGTEALRVRPSGTPVAMLALGINRFKEVNDTLGHLAGDDVLRVTASRLAAFAGPGDLVARLSGDEFAILVMDLDADSPVDAATARAHALADELAVPTEVTGVHLAVEASVGVAIGFAGEHEIAELLRRADIAMYRAKLGAGSVATYGGDGGDAIAGDPDRLSVVIDLREAMECADQLVLAVQPAIDLDTGAPVGAEALIRWRHPRRGLLAPADFVEVINHSDLVAPFTRFVVDRALGLAEEWARDGLPLPVSVNLSSRSLADASLPRDIEGLLQAHGIKPEMLILEITESAVVTGQKVVGEVLGALRGLGVQLAVDDFGTGYSSLTFLTRVQVDEVKVDSSFVGAMVGSLEAAAIVRTTVDLGRRLGVRVVAEGVETAEQRTALRELGCEIAQGRHLMPPVASERATAVLRELAAGAMPNRVFPLPA